MNGSEKAGIVFPGGYDGFSHGSLLLVTSQPFLCRCQTIPLFYMIYDMVTNSVALLHLCKNILGLQVGCQGPCVCLNSENKTKYIEKTCKVEIYWRHKIAHDCV